MTPLLRTKIPPKTMASLLSSAANSADAGNATNLNNPPLAPCLQQKTTAQAFSATNAEVSFQRQITLTVEMPLKEDQDKATDIALCFKRFAAALLRADSSLEILNWFNPLQNPIKSAGDIACDKATIEQYYAGMRVLHSRRRVFGTIKVRTTESFKKTKGETQFWTWLHKNKVFVRQTQLSQSRHANLGWLMFSHPEYTN